MSTLAAFYNQLSANDAVLLEKQAQALFQEQEEDAAARLMARGFADELSKLAQDKDPLAIPKAPSTAAPAQQKRITRAPSTDYRPPTQEHVTQPKQLMESPRAGRPVTPTYRPRPSPRYTPTPDPTSPVKKKVKRRKKLVPKKGKPWPYQRKPAEPGARYLRRVLGEPIFATQKGRQFVRAQTTRHKTEAATKAARKAQARREVGKSEITWAETPTPRPSGAGPSARGQW